MVSKSIFFFQYFLLSINLFAIDDVMAYKTAIFDDDTYLK